MVTVILTKRDCHEDDDCYHGLRLLFSRWADGAEEVPLARSASFASFALALALHLSVALAFLCDLRNGDNDHGGEHKPTSM